MAEQREQGLALLDRMLGKAMADQLRGMLAAELPMKPMVENLVDECYGGTWHRDTLTLRERSLITVAMMLAVDRRDELQTHIRGALANGATPAELWEMANHATHYLGLPAAGTMAHAISAVLQAGDD